MEWGWRAFDTEGEGAEAGVLELLASGGIDGGMLRTAGLIVDCPGLLKVNWAELFR